MFFAPHAVDNNRFLKSEANNLRAQLGVSNEEIIFLFAGKFETKKNPAILLDAFIESGVKNAHLLIVGDGHLKIKLETKVLEQNLDIQRRVHFMDFQNQSKMPGIYKTCDVLVLPSQGPGETWGLVVNEAMASSKTVLVSDKCGCYLDLVKDGAKGFTFVSDDKKELIKKMQQLSMQKDLLTKMGNKSRELILGWNYQKVCETIENVLYGN